jgi:uncharacterized protein YcfJ
MKKIITTIFLVSAFNAVASDGFTDFARVVDVEKIMKTNIYKTPYQSCKLVDVPIYNKHDRRGRHYDNNSNTNAILGAIIGGVIGNQMGKGRGKKVMTGAGAILGASIGGDYRRQKPEQHIVGYKQVEKCSTKYKKTRERVLDYYLVSARYNNKNFTFESKTKPYKKIEVNVVPI